MDHQWLTDDELNKLVQQAEAGGENEAVLALAETALRIAHGKTQTSKSAELLLGALLATLKRPPREVVKFLFPNRRLKRGAPRKRTGPYAELSEASVLGQVRSEGFKDVSNDRADDRVSSYQETARRLGFNGAHADREAERLKKSVQRAEKEMVRKYGDKLKK